MEVLRPQDVLGERFRLPTASFHPQRTLPANGSIAVKRKQQRKSPPKNDKTRSNAPSEAKQSNHSGATDRRRRGEITSGGLVMGKVTLLKRGQPPKIPKSSKSQKIAPKKTSLVAPPPPVDRFAGSCISPPSPRSLPLPTFSNKKVDADSFDDDASKFLRRVLRLE